MKKIIPVLLTAALLLAGCSTMAVGENGFRTNSKDGVVYYYSNAYSQTTQLAFYFSENVDGTTSVYIRTNIESMGEGMLDYTKPVYLRFQTGNNVATITLPTSDYSIRTDVKAHEPGAAVFFHTQTFDGEITAEEAKAVLDVFNTPDAIDFTVAAYDADMRRVANISHAQITHNTSLLNFWSTETFPPAADEIPAEADKGLTPFDGWT